MLIHMNGVAGWFGAGGFHLWSPMMAADEVGMWRVKVPSSLLLLAMELEIGDSVGGIFNQNWLLFSGIEHRIEIRLYVGGWWTVLYSANIVFMSWSVVCWG